MLLQSKTKAKDGSTQTEGIELNSTVRGIGVKPYKEDRADEYEYESIHPNRLTSIKDGLGNTLKSFGYDDNGNITSNGSQTIIYDAFNKPIEISETGALSKFTYGADIMRYRQETPAGTTIYYIDKLMEIEFTSSNADFRHYITDVAILTKTGDLNDPAPSIGYIHRDRLGSVANITDHTGLIQEATGYDAFGKPRNGDWSDKDPATRDSAITDRGFTDHEHLDDHQLIHMNGRGYDYGLGRFLSVDPIIQEPGNSQSLNGYAYIMNNPLSGTDPSGYCSVEKDTTASCSASVEPGSTQDITNADGDVVGHVGKDANGNLYVTGNGASFNQGDFQSMVGGAGKLAAGADFTKLGAEVAKHGFQVNELLFGPTELSRMNVAQRGSATSPTSSEGSSSNTATQTGGISRTLRKIRTWIATTFFPWHYKRHRINSLNLYGMILPTTGLTRDILEDDFGFIRSGYRFKVYHDMGRGNAGNQRYSIKSGRYAGAEVVVDLDGNLVTNQPQNAASFNYAQSKLGHFFMDMLPYFAFGNSPNDPTNTFGRLSRTLENPRRRLFERKEAYGQ